MTKEFKSNPFQLSEDEMEAKAEAERVKRIAGREREEDEAFERGEVDHPAVEAGGNFGLRAMDVGEQAVDGFANATHEAASLPRTLREKRAARQADEPILDPNQTDRIPGKPDPNEPMLDSSSLSLRLPK